MDNNTHNFQNEDYYQDDSSGIITEVPFLAKSYLFLGRAMFVSGLVGLGLGKLTTYYPEIMMYAFYGGAIVVLITSFLININAYKRKSTNLLKSKILPISIDYSQYLETKVIRDNYTLQNVDKKATLLATSKLNDKLNNKDVIINKKVLKKYEKDSKILVEFFFKVKEDITDTISIDNINIDDENVKDKEQ